MDTDGAVQTGKTNKGKGRELVRPDEVDICYVPSL